MFGINPLIRYAYEAGLQPALGLRHLPRASTAWAALPWASMDKPVGLQKPSKLAKSDDLQLDVFSKLLQRAIYAVIHLKQSNAQTLPAQGNALERTHNPSPTGSPILAQGNALGKSQIKLAA